MGKAKIWPHATLKPLNRSSPTFTCMITSSMSPILQISSKLNKGFRFCACAISRIKLFTQLFVRFLRVLHLVYSQDARTDFDAKYVKRRGSAQGCAFWGFQNQKLSFFHPFLPQKPPFWGPFSTLENAFNIGHVLSKRPLIVIVAS